MKASELRIGNWMVRQFEDNAPSPPEEVTIRTLWDIFQLETIPTTGKFTFTAIPLTEQWLEKAGFHGIDDDGLWAHPDEPLFELQCEYLNDPYTFAHIWDTSFTGVPIQYVHQLQNLFFAMTGKELAFNPNFKPN